MTARAASRPCRDEDEAEARCLLFYSLWIGNHFIAADHSGRAPAEIVKRALAEIGAE